MIRFDIDSSKGQMTAKQRQMLYNIVMMTTPTTVLEVGTWKGYGSTYTILEALNKLDFDGKLITYEIDPDIFAEAKALYSGDLLHLADRLEMNLGNVLTCWPKEKISFAWLDGADDPAQALAQVERLTTCMIEPKVIGCHDWNDIKMMHAKPLLEQIATTTCMDDSGVGIWFGKLK